MVSCKKIEVYSAKSPSRLKVYYNLISVLMRSGSYLTFASTPVPVELFLHGFCSA